MPPPQEQLSPVSSSPVVESSHKSAVFLIVSLVVLLILIGLVATIWYFGLFRSSQTTGVATTQTSPSTTIAQQAGNSVSELSAGYGQWFTVKNLPSYCQGDNPKLPDYPTVPAYGTTLIVHPDGIYSNDTKLDVDTPSFEVFCEKNGARDFWKDANQLYDAGSPSYGYIDGNPSEGTYGSKVDLPSFMPLESGSVYEIYGKDKNHVFAKQQGIDGALVIVSDADVNSFVANPALYPFAKDNQHVFLHDKIVAGIDPNTFEVLGTAHGRDNVHVYWFGSNGGPTIVEPINGADVNSFVEPPMWNGYGKDANHIYAGTTMCPKIDVASFVVIKTATTSEAHDKNNEYSGCLTATEARG